MTNADFETDFRLFCIGVCRYMSLYRWIQTYPLFRHSSSPPLHRVDRSLTLRVARSPPLLRVARSLTLRALPGVCPFDPQSVRTNGAGLSESYRVDDDPVDREME